MNDDEIIITKISSCYTYVLNISTQRILKKEIKYLIRIALHDLTYMMSVVDPRAIGVETIG